LSDEQWLRIGPLLPGKAGDPGRSRYAAKKQKIAELTAVNQGLASTWQKLFS
jgi:hypothetical protein